MGRGDGAIRSPRTFKVNREASGPEKEIIRRISEKGPVTFREFMEAALYSPDGGYYTSAESRWGGAGDYITNLDVSPVFPRVLAKEVVEMWDLLGRPPGFELIEAGAGRGWLSKGILSALKYLSPELSGTVKIRMIEKNHNLREPPSGNISWYGDILEVPAGVTGCILSNELIDSFPVHRVEYREGGLLEVYTGFDGVSFVDVTGPPSTAELEEYFRKTGVALREGQRCEVNLDATDWIRKAGGVLRKGFILTLDYGLPARELYSQDRKGTLLCHFRHTPNDNPYLNIGSQDITTHVDFTALTVWGAEAGLERAGFTTQKNFLLGLGILDELKEPLELDLGNYDKIRHNQGIKDLIMPGGIGDVFKVLIQYKGIGKPALKGFSFKDMSRYL